MSKDFVYTEEFAQRCEMINAVRRALACDDYIHPDYARALLAAYDEAIGEQKEEP